MTVVIVYVEIPVKILSEKQEATVCISGNEELVAKYIVLILIK